MTHPSLRPYQHDIVASVDVAMDVGIREIMVVLSTGAGKTRCFTHLTATFMLEGKVTWIIAHRQELIRQASDTLSAFGIGHGIIQAGTTPKLSAKVQVASIQTLIRRFATFPPPDVIILDECFPPETLVDGRPIEAIHAGDQVWSFNHTTGREEKREVLGIMSRQYGGSWYRITASDGSSFVCTENHPIYIEGTGYVAAKTTTTRELQILRRRNDGQSYKSEIRPAVLRHGMSSSCEEERERRVREAHGLLPMRGELYARQPKSVFSLCAAWVGDC